MTALMMAKKRKTLLIAEHHERNVFRPAKLMILFGGGGTDGRTDGRVRKVSGLWSVWFGSLSIALADNAYINKCICWQRAIVLYYPLWYCSLWPAHFPRKANSHSQGILLIEMTSMSIQIALRQFGLSAFVTTGILVESKWQMAKFNVKRSSLNVVTLITSILSSFFCFVSIFLILAMASEFLQHSKRQRIYRRKCCAKRLVIKRRPGKLYMEKGLG